MSILLCFCVVVPIHLRFFAWCFARRGYYFFACPVMFIWIDQQFSSLTQQCVQQLQITRGDCPPQEDLNFVNSTVRFLNDSVQNTGSKLPLMPVTSSQSNRRSRKLLHSKGTELMKPFSQRSMRWRLVALPNSDGRGPESWFRSTLRSVRKAKLPSSDGSGPIRLFLPSPSCSNFSQFPNSVGILPLKSFKTAWKYSNDVSCPSSVGSVPSRLFSEI
mmetsp:Transcript_1351/g.3314  ORF Transcript_1351/g.3314 Transcript_1351/m.3314 type:complete len:217 (+) Transcript_1351:69-719(+)